MIPKFENIKNHNIKDKRLLMSNMENLTQGAVETLKQMDKDVDTSYTPIMQVINVRQVSGTIGKERYRITLSDGTDFVQGMLATKLIHLVKENKIMENTVLKVREFLINVIQ